MNRVIKFRAWDIEKEEMGFLTSNALKELMLNDCFEKLQEQYDIMQFTGLKDSKGKETYEGDILKSKLSRLSLSDKDTEEVLSVVKFSKGSFRAILHNIIERYYGAQYEACRDFSDFEVIGNIYENPELLK